MSERWIRPTCFAILIVVWALDLLTPQLFVIAILFNVPIALSTLTRDSRFTRLLVAVALIFDAIAGYANGVSDGFHWDGVAIGDRLITGCSFLLVGALTFVAQRSAARAAELSARQERSARERRVRRSVEAVRGSINPELIERAIVREARVTFAVASARFYGLRRIAPECTETIARPGGEIDKRSGRPEPSSVSLVQRIAASVADGGEGVVRTWFISGDDALGRLLLATLDTAYAAAVPLVEHRTLFGVLLVSRTGPFEPHFDEAFEYFATQAAIALAQAALFVQLAERNDELANVNGALSERSDVIRDIVYALSHDLRTPLVAARMTLQQARDGAFGEMPQAYREILDRSIASNEELHRLAETLLLVSRYESDDRSTLRTPVDLVTLAHAALEELEPLWRRKHLTVSSASEVASAVVSGDKSELQRALINLLANAITWTPPGGSIVVRARECVGHAVVAVEDDGYGVPSAERAGLFERVRGTPGRQGAGTGLGLYLARRIAESHGGTITYAQGARGGSTFTLDLPVFVQAGKL